MTYATYAPRVPAHPTRTGSKRTNPPIPRLLVLHTSEGAEGINSAEALARFIQTPRTPGNLASYHYIADTDDVIPIVPDNYVAYANAGANHDSLTLCYPGTIRQNADEWMDDTSSAYHEQVARWLVDKSLEYGIALTRLTDAEVMAGRKGIVDHWCISRCYKKSTHTDLGRTFPWDHLIGRARQLAAPPPPPPTPGDDDMAAPATVIDGDGNGWVFFRGRDAALWFQRGTEGAHSLGGKITDAISAECQGDVINIYAYAVDGDVYLWQFRAGNLSVDKALVQPA